MFPFAACRALQTYGDAIVPMNKWHDLNLSTPEENSATRSFGRGNCSAVGPGREPGADGATAAEAGRERLRQKEESVGLATHRFPAGHVSACLHNLHRTEVQSCRRARGSAVMCMLVTIPWYVSLLPNHRAWYRERMAVNSKR